MKRKPPETWGSLEIAMMHREIERAQSIVTTECLWPASLVALSERVLREWAGWNVTPLPLPSLAAGPRRASSLDNGPAGRGKGDK